MRQISIALAAIASLHVVACTVDLPDSHPEPTQASAPAPVIIQLAPSVVTQPSSPTSVPTQSPSAPSSATPSPSSPSPSSSGCGLPPGTGDGDGCPRTSGMFIDDMDRAHQRVQARRPDLVQGGRIRTENWNTYYGLMVDELKGMGYCAVFDGEEIAVKNTNAFNEQYHVITSAGEPRTGEGSYRSTCRPAWF